MNKRKRLIIIDCNSIIHRAFHAIPPLATKKGELVNAVYGFTSVLLKLLRELQPVYIAACFDTAAPTFRHQAYKEYKANRVRQPQEFYDQIPLAKEVLQALNIPFFEKDGYEADDLIGILTKTYYRPEIEIVIVTGDLDTLQLVDQKTRVYFLHQGVSGVKIYDENQVKSRYNLGPQQLLDFKALVGDPSDNIPGIKGVGKKTALELIKRFGSLEAIYEYLEKDDVSEIKEGIKKLLIKQKESAFLSKQLVAIIKEPPQNLFLEIKIWPGPNSQKVMNTFKQLGFKSLAERFQKQKINPGQTKIF